MQRQCKRRWCIDQRLGLAPAPCIAALSPPAAAARCPLPACLPWATPYLKD